MFKKTIEVPEGWFFQAKEDAEVAREQALTIEALEGHIESLEFTINAQNHILEDKLGMVPIDSAEKMNSVAEELSDKALELHARESDLDEREHTLMKEYCESKGVPFSSGGDIKKFVKSLTKSKKEAN